MPLLESDFDIKYINKYSKTDLINICVNNYKYSDEPVDKSELKDLNKSQLSELIVDILKAKKSACKNISKPNKVIKTKPKSCDDYIMKDLKELCKRKNLPTSGTKSQLCERLNIKYSECANDKKVKFKKSHEVKEYSDESESSESSESESESSESESEEELKNNLSTEQQEILDELNEMTIKDLKIKAVELNLNISGKTKSNIIQLLFNYYTDNENNEVIPTTPTKPTPTPTKPTPTKPTPTKHTPTKHTTNTNDNEVKVSDDKYTRIHEYIKEIIDENIKSNIILSTENVLDLVETKFDTRDVNINYFIDNKFIYIYGNLLSYIDVVKIQSKISFNEYINTLNLQKSLQLKGDSQKPTNKFDEFKLVDSEGTYVIDDMLINCYNIINIKVSEEDKIIEYYLTFNNNVTKQFEDVFGDDNDTDKVWEFCYLKLKNHLTNNIDILNHIKKDGSTIYFICKTLLEIPKSQIPEFLKLNNTNGVLCDDFYITFMHYSKNKLVEISNEYTNKLRGINTYFKKCSGGQCKFNVEACIKNQADKKQKIINNKVLKKIEYKTNKIQQSKSEFVKYETKTSQKQNIVNDIVKNVNEGDFKKSQRDNFTEGVFKNESEKDFNKLELKPLGKDKNAENKMIAISKAKMQNLNKVVVDTSNMKMPTKLENIAHCLKLI